MSRVPYAACARAASRFVRHRPALFTEAARWVISKKPSTDVPKGSPATSAHSPAYRTAEALVLHYRSLLDQEPETPIATKQDAYCAILTSWLLQEEAHEPLARAGSPYDPAHRPQCLWYLPVLGPREFMLLTTRYALHADPHWHRLLLAAWRLVDPGYLTTAHDASHTEVATATNSAAPSESMPKSIRLARDSYDWVRENASHLFKDGTNKYPLSAFKFVMNPENACPAYSKSKPNIKHQTWERYIRRSARWRPLPK